MNETNKETTIIRVDFPGATRQNKNLVIHKYLHSYEEKDCTPRTGSYILIPSSKAEIESQERWIRKSPNIQLIANLYALDCFIPHVLEFGD